MVKELFKECKELVENGTSEITLLGQNVNAYNYEGKDSFNFRNLKN